MAPPPNHLEFIRSLPCLRCGRAPCESAHVRYDDARAAKLNPGIGKKSATRWTVPLCSDCHRGVGGQHTRGERVWWQELKVDPVFVALALWAVSGDYATGRRIALHHYYHNSRNDDPQVLTSNA